MKIRYFILILTVICFSTGSFAQLKKAISDYDKFAPIRSVPGTERMALLTISSAKTAIDKALEDPKTANDPVTWTYRTLIYADMALLDTIDATSAPLFAEAISSQKKALELDKDGANKAKLESVNIILAQYYLNKGEREYRKSKFEESYNSFEKGLIYSPGDPDVIYYAGLAAINAHNYDNAIKKYASLTTTNLDAKTLGQVYVDLSKLYAMQKDTASAIRIASEGAVKFPDKLEELMTWEVELSMLTGKGKDIIGKIQSLREKNSKNKLFPYYLGIIYSDLNDYDKAEEAYKGAIAIDSAFNEVYLYLGSTILNKGLILYKAANALPQNKQSEAQYNDLIKKANIEFDNAFPYLIKSTQLNPKSIDAFKDLRTYYLLKNDNAKAEELSQKIKALQ